MRHCVYKKPETTRVAGILFTLFLILFSILMPNPIAGLVLIGVCLISAMANRI
jgi:hypothetical protein